MSEVWFEPYTREIRDSKLSELTNALLLKYNDKITTLPPSLSGRYHKAEVTIQHHLERTFKFAKIFTEEFALNQDDKDILLSSALLHDIGNCEFADKKRNTQQYQKLYEIGYNRSREAYTYHPVLSSALILNFMMNSDEQVNEKIIKVSIMVSTHMEHWIPECPQPSTFLQKLLALADCLASKPNIILTEKK